MTFSRMSHQVPTPEEATVREMDEHASGLNGVTPDVAVKRLLIANVAFFGLPGAGDRQWVLIDAGIPGSAAAIARAARRRFGKDSRPAAILLTHGHFDHVGGLAKLARHWEVPIYAHPLELQFLDGSRSYPPPDPSVGGGLMARMALFYPRGPVDVFPWLHALPPREVPHMPGWRWLHTPGHTPGHVSFFRESDRALIAGDAFITTDQESAYAVARQAPELHGPPQYYTTDWVAARDSVRCLAALEPELVVTGHGPPMRGELMLQALHRLASDFDRIAVPPAGMYVPERHAAA